MPSKLTIGVGINRLGPKVVCTTGSFIFGQAAMNGISTSSPTSPVYGFAFLSRRRIDTSFFIALLTLIDSTCELAFNELTAGICGAAREPAEDVRNANPTADT